MTQEMILVFYIIGAFIWFCLHMEYLIKKFGWVVAVVFPIFVALSILWPVIKARPDNKKEHWLLKTFG